MTMKIIEFSEPLAPYFESINRQWIEKMFTLEPVDKYVIENPYEAIIKPGGAIWFAESEQYGICGTCAVMKKKHAYELTKMGVDENARGEKVGEHLLKHVIQETEKRNFRPLYLLTNKHCEAAIHLYLKNGFVHDNQIMESFGGDYQRCDVAMRYS
jgi:N-acetylglutamate synthase-like GNAT family acetyltransferase